MQEVGCWHEEWYAGERNFIRAWGGNGEKEKDEAIASFVLMGGDGEVEIG